MKIGIDIRNIGRKRTGDETVFFHLVKNLALIDRENEYELFVDRRNDGELADMARRLGTEGLPNFRFVVLEARNKFDWNLLVLPRRLRRSPVDVYHTQYILPFFVPRSIRIVQHIHDVSFRAYPKYIHWKDRLFLALLIPRSLRRADGIVAVSEFTKDEICLRYGVDSAKVEVILNALGEDFENVSISDEQGRAVRKKYRLPERFILYLGTLQPRKNVPSLVRAYAAVADRLPGTALVLAGNRAGHHFDPGIDGAVRESGLGDRVVFPGYVDQADMPALMRAASVFAFPSLYEGFGIPLLEAMSQDVPVVASDIPCLREIGGKAAAYVDAANLAEFSETLYNVSIDSSLRERMVRLGRERVRRFSWRRSAESLLALYARLYRTARS
jgi:glycosyltransferase involved in cell wall biosynthesis